MSALLSAPLFALLGCGVGADTSGVVGDSGGTFAGVEIEEITYQLTWDLEGADLDPAGGWTAVNDLGVRFVVTGGYLVANSLSLSPCSFAAASGPLDWLIPAARAGHSDETDPSALPAPWVEALVTPGSQRLGTLAFDAGLYCQLHVLIAPGETGATGLPEAPDMVGVSLHLEGSWVGLDGGAATPFAVSVDTAWGGLYDLTDAPAGAATVTVIRPLAGMFTGLDPSTLPEDVLGQEMIVNLVEGSALRWD